jgi:hypothetical protein
LIIIWRNIAEQRSGDVRKVKGAGSGDPNLLVFQEMHIEKHIHRTHTEEDHEEQRGEEKREREGLRLFPGGI